MRSTRSGGRELSWAPGETLVFQVAPDPDFTALFGSPEGVIPYFERALAAWSDIPTADIKLRVDGVIEDDENLHRPTLYINSDTVSSVAGYASSWDRFYSGRWERFSCDIGMAAQYGALPTDLTGSELDERRQELLDAFVYTLVHEVGHCIGLLHAGAFSSTYRWAEDRRRDVFLHPLDPAMSYGWSLESPEALSADDVVGASLLRPTASFQQTTGTISGTLELAGEPVPYAHVWALPFDGDPLRDRVGALSDRVGAFRIEGLEPGAYALWASPISQTQRTPQPRERGAPSGSGGNQRGTAHSGRGRQEHRGGEDFPATGRAVRRRPDGRRRDTAAASQSPGPATSITRNWGSPCMGVRLRAEKRPALADGPGADRVRRIGNVRWYSTTLTVEWSTGSSGVVLDWVGPYRDWYWNFRDEEEGWEFFDNSGPQLDVNISNLRIESNGPEGAVHTAEIAWPGSRRRGPALPFRRWGLRRGTVSDLHHARLRALFRSDRCAMSGRAGAGMLRENPQTRRRGRPVLPAARRPAPRGPSPRGRRWAAAVLASFVPLIGSERGDAYRFRAADVGPWSTKERAAVVSAADAVRWSPAVWGPGQTLVFEVAPDPDFEVLFDSPEGVIPYFERALAAWSDIPTADIRFRVDGVADGNRHLNKLFANPEDGGRWGAQAWDRFYSGKWERFLCDIGLSPWYASTPDDLDPEELDEFRGARREQAVARLVHELGHCIGLEHAGALSSTHRWVWDAPDWVLVHPRDPAMSVGHGPESPDELSADDIAGASLLRPASSFRAATGNHCRNPRPRR